METDGQNLGLYTVHVEGSILPLRDKEFVTDVVTRSTDGELENALVMATPEQVAKLREFLRIREIVPTTDGIYVGQNGIWYAVKQGQVALSGHWVIPHDVLTSFRAVDSPAIAVGTQSVTAERDPVCGMLLKPGQEEANVRYQDRTYHFCSAECRDLFLKNPAQYVASLTGAGQPSNN